MSQSQPHADDQPSRRPPTSAAGLHAQVVSLQRRNEGLVRTLETAREQLVTLKQQVEALATPPSSYGVVLSRHDDGTLDVLAAGRRLRVQVSPGVEADDLVVDAWAARMRSELSALVQETVGVDGLADRLVIGDGLTFSEAAGTVHWRDSDLVLVGPASRAPLARVFLGSRASKIVRAVPVPVVLLPNED